MDKHSHNVVIEGIKESNNEDLRSIIDNLFSDLELDYTVEWCDAIFRLGPKTDSKRSRAAKGCISLSPLQTLDV